MEKIKKDIREIQREIILVKNSYKEILENKRKELEKLEDSLYAQVKEKEIKKKELYHILLMNILKNKEVNFSIIDTLVVSEESCETGEKFFEYNTYDNITTEYFEVDDYTQYQDSNYPKNYKWSSLISVLNRLNSTSENLDVFFDEEWETVKISDKENFDEYCLFLKQKENIFQVEMSIYTQNAEGICSLKLFFNLVKDF